MTIDAVVVEENLSQSNIYVAEHGGGKTYFKVWGGCQITKGDVIIGPLGRLGNQRIYNKTMEDDFLAAILIVREHEVNQQ